jgi:hypothetical protein
MSPRCSEMGGGILTALQPIRLSKNPPGKSLRTRHTLPKQFQDSSGSQQSLHFRFGTFPSAAPYLHALDIACTGVQFRWCLKSL